MLGLDSLVGGVCVRLDDMGDKHVQLESNLVGFGHLRSSRRFLLD